MKVECFIFHQLQTKYHRDIVGCKLDAINNPRIIISFSFKFLQFKLPYLHSYDFIETEITLKGDKQAKKRNLFWWGNERQSLILKH